MERGTTELNDTKAKMLQVLNKINVAHHLKRELVQKAEAECTQLREAEMIRCGTHEHC